MTRAKPAATARLLRALERQDEANERARKAARAAFPDGTRVSWWHGEHLRHGEVIDVTGFGANVNLRIKTPSGARVWKDVHAVLRGEGLL